MEKVTLAQLHTNLEENLTQQEIERIVLETVNEMKHYQQVNKRFTDKLTEKGLNAYIIKEHNTDKLYVGMYVGPNHYRLDMRDYGQKLSWKVIIKDLERYKLKEEKARILEKIDSHAQDVTTLREILAFIESKPMKNFDLWRIISDMKDAIQYSI
jgi:hypothetical protein